ncbi:MAG: phosphatase PAP2 family protein [Candidatus Pacebacteria bacterium]|nr:phosphatase PAP2 family protein [Candidatus Paceibacterota bacterium]
MIRAFLTGLPMGFARIFAPRYLVWHVVMIILTYLCVVSGFDWYYFTQTRFDNLYALSMPAALLGFFLPIVGPIVLYYWGEWQGSHKLKGVAIAVAQAEALGWFISSLYKSLTGRIQPEFLPSTVLEDISRQFNFGIWENGIFWGWPSSHTTVAFAGTMALIWLHPKNKALALLAGAYALYIGLGVSVSVHWFSDFLAGAILGTLIGVVTARGRATTARLRAVVQ